MKKEKIMDGEMPTPPKSGGFIKGKTVTWVGRHRIMQFVREDEDGNVIKRVGYAVFTPDGRLIASLQGFLPSEQDAVSLARGLDNKTLLLGADARSGGR